MPRYVRPTIAPQVVDQRLELINYYLQRAQEWADSFNLRITVTNGGETPRTVRKGALKATRWECTKATRNQTQYENKHGQAHSSPISPLQCDA